METKDIIKSHIARIIDNTFEMVSKVYANNKENSPKKEAIGSRLVFPHYSTNYRNGETRISEQELRFIFVEQFITYCDDNNLEWYYSVETPTEKKYSFTNNNPRCSEDGQSAMIDLTIHDENFNRIAIIEFKALNPKRFCFEKDFVKLSSETEGTDILPYFIMMIKSSDQETLKSIASKVCAKGDTTLFRCIQLEDTSKEITKDILEIK